MADSTLKVASNITDQVITVAFSGSTYMVPRDNKVAAELIQALKAKDYDKVPDLVDKSKAISKFSDGNFSIINGEVWIGTWRAPQVLADRIIKFQSEDLPYEPLIKFGEKLKNNPSFRAVQQLFGFLSHNNMPLTEDGNFIAYKRVSKDLKDIRTGTFDNSVGTVVSMPRNEVNEDPEQTCSYGLHIAAWEYAQKHYGNSDEDVMLEVEVDPSDIVAIPNDYNDMKCRCCKYVVKAIVQNPREENLLVKEAQVKTYDDCGDACESCDEDDDDDDDDCDCVFCSEVRASEDEEDDDEDEDYYDDECLGECCGTCGQCDLTLQVEEPAVEIAEDDYYPSN